MPELLDELSLSKQDGTFRKVINSYCKTELLIIDEWYGRIDPEYDEGSPIAKAIMDRITNNAYDVLIEGIVLIQLERNQLPA